MGRKFISIIQVLVLSISSVLSYSIPNTASALVCGTGSNVTFTAMSDGRCRGFIVSGTSFTVPTNWTAMNTIEVIGGGGGGASAAAGQAYGGGGGGAYAKTTNAALTAGASVTVAVGAGGSANGSGGDTYICSSTSNCASIAGSAVVAGAKGGVSNGTGSTSGGAGGAAGSSVGSVTYSGGDGGSGSFSGGGGGGSGGPRGNGAAGGSGTSGGYGAGGGGGGGSSGGSGGASGGNPNAGADTGGSGGAGGNNASGSGGGSGGAGYTGGAGGSPNASGSSGGGGGGGPGASATTQFHGFAGGSGSMAATWDSTHGSGAGGGGGAASGGPAAGAQVGGNGGAGGSYGAGGGSGGLGVAGGGSGGSGAQGIIVITYGSPALSKPPNNLGLVGYWNFDEATSTTATDFSGNGNTGTLSGSTLPSWTNGKLGKALNFDGASSYIDAGTPSGPTSAITISAWIKKDADTAWASILDRYNGENSDCFSLGLDSTNGKKLMFVWNGSSGDGWTNRVVANSDISLNQWTHVVASSDGSTVTFYVNGVADGSVSAGAVCASGSLKIGVNLSGGDEYFDGSIDEVRLYSRALPATEVANLYGTGVVRFTSNSKVLTQGSSLEQGLVGLYTFDGADTQWTGSGVAYDRSGNNRTAPISGMTRDIAQTIGKLGQAFSFSGATSEYVQAAGFSEIGTSNQPYTMAAWVKPATGGSTGDVIHVSSASNGSGWCLSMLQVVSGKAFALSWPSNTVTGATTLAAGQWYHLVHTWDATNGLRVYVNGALDGSAAQGTFSANGTAMYVAVGSPLPGGTACALDSGVGFNGAIDDVRMYSRALSTSEISQLYRLGQVKMR